MKSSWPLAALLLLFAAGQSPEVRAGEKQGERKQEKGAKGSLVIVGGTAVVWLTTWRGNGRRSSSSHTSRAASAFSAPIPSPTTRSGHAVRHTAAVARPAAIIAMLASASFRADKKAARVRLPA